MQEHWICRTCGAQFIASEQPPSSCPICEDERQYLGHNGQLWTTAAQLYEEGRRNEVREHEPGLFGIGTTPAFAIGQRALLVQNPAGNVLWDCISLIDDETVAQIQRLGGVSAIALSHPHLQGSVVEWAERLDARVYVHAADRQWYQRPSERITFWEGESLALPGGLTLHRLGGHFAGSTVLLWPQGAEGRGVLMSGDTIQIVQDRRWVSFMYSYPNLIPLSARAVQHIAERIEPLEFERLYSGWWESIVARDAQQAVLRSARRYLQALQKTTYPLE